MFKEIIPVSSDNHTKPINTKCSLVDFKTNQLALKAVKI
jgi:hypothetical protein